jgi:hypothetical protein
MLRAKGVAPLAGLRLARLDFRRPAAFAAEPAAAETADLDELLQDKRRRKLWDLGENLHCSIIGTCLATGELRQLLVKVKLAGAETASDHELHGKAVLLARSRDVAGKLLNKALDKRHRIALNHFAKATSDEAVSALWSEAVKRGEIPGAYWAVLTHPATTEALLRKVFGEVHMLSHLVGAANRADIRRLHQLEEERAELVAKIERQQAQLREVATTRDAKIRGLSHELSQRIAADATGAAQDEAPAQAAALSAVIADLQRRLAAATARHERAENRLEQSLAARTRTEEACRRALHERDTMRQELDAAEDNLTALLAERAEASALDLRGLSVLYIGGRPNQVAQLRALSERASAQFLHHGGGIDERGGLLPGLISRADIALFPIDCISHEAALLVKRLCRQSGKPWMPLRTASVSAFLAAVGPLRATLDEARSLVPLS